MIKGLIFCVDGVIADISSAHHDAWQNICGRIGCRFDRNDYELLKDLSSERAMRIILDLGNKHCREKDIEKLCEEKKRYFLDMVGNLPLSVRTPGIREFLSQAADAGFQTCALSADGETAAVLKQLGMTDAFERIITEDSASCEQLLQTAADEMGIRTGECILFTRSAAFISAARSLAMRTVGYADPETAFYSDYYIRSFINLNAQILVRKAEGE